MNMRRLAALGVAGVMTASVFTGCGANTAVATTTTGVQVNFDLANFMCRYQQAYSADFYAAYYGVTDWEDDNNGSGSIADSARDNVMETLHEFVTAEQHAAEVGVALTQDEIDAIENATNTFLADNDAKTLKEMGATHDVVVRYLTLVTLRDKVYTSVASAADTNVSDAEANMSEYTILEVATNGYIDYSTYSYVEFTEEESAKRAQDAVAIYEEIEDAADLEAIAKEYGYITSVGYYDQADTRLDATVKATLDGLKDGEMSELITTDTTLYIVRMDAKTNAEKTEENRASIIEERKSSLYEDTLKGWQENDGWKVKEKALKKVNFKDTFTLLDETETEEGTEN